MRVRVFAFTLLTAGFVGLASGQTNKPGVRALQAAPPRPGYTYREAQRLRTLDGLERHRVQVNVQDAVGSNVEVFELPSRVAPPASPGQARTLAQLRELHYQDILLAVAGVFIGILVFRMLMRESAGSLKMRFNSPSPAAAGHLASVRAEEEAFAEFLAVLHPRSPAPPPSTPAAAPDCEVIVTQEVQEPDPGAREDEPTAFFAGVPAWLSDLQRLLEEIGRSQSDSRRQGLLRELRDGFGAIEGIARFPELLPVSYLASALEGLVRQLEARMNNVTPSTLRTVANGLNALADLCRPGLRADLCADPPLRFLVADSDPISRSAITYALQRAFNQPDLAEDGAGALNLASEHTYDAIFLDAQPGNDGVEICSKIRETAANAATAVVFVISLDNFDSRATSISTGSEDFIAKPFLSFEVIVKALTFALRGRLEGCADVA
jgi:CheY-like chemotaxis protein